MRHWRELLLVMAACALGAPGAHAQLPILPGGGPAPHPYGKDDGGGFRNILPPGTKGNANAAEGAAFLANGTRPSHNNDQLAMYGDLVYSAPGLQAKDLSRFFKDATFGVRPDDVESTISPRSDAVIVRDKGFGTPHVTASTRSGAMFALGFATGQDRLFLVDVLRHIGRGELASFAGGSRGNRQLDRDQWALAPYSEEELQRQFDQLDDLYGARGAQIQDDIQEYVAGLNAYAGRARLNPLELPAEYAALGKPIDQFKVTDPVAIASLVGGIFGKGGGGELDSALILRAARQKFGARRGTRVWRDFRQAEDPEHDVTIKQRRVRYLQPDRKQAKGAVTMPDAGSVRKTPVGSELPAAQRSARGPGGTLANLGDRLRMPESMSNALLVSGRESASGRPLAVFGPQTSYFSPQILMEQDVHAPGLDARGAAFPGTNLYVQLGRGRDYAWSATASGQDNTDVFAVPLCEPGGGRATTRSAGYVFRGSCRPIEVLERRNSWSPTVADQTPAGAETLRAERTALGLIEARATVKGKPVAFTKLRSTYRHELDSALGFSALNDPGRIRSYRDFNRAVYDIGYTFHWFYADRDDIAMFDSGDVPMRAKGASRDLPTTGTRRFEWQGFDPIRNRARYEPARRRPAAVNEPYFTNWNNGSSRGYYSSDREFGYGPVHRARTLTDRVRSRTKGPRKTTLPELVDAMEDAGTVDVRGAYVAPLLVKAIGRSRDPKIQAATKQLANWAAGGGHRRDRDRDGTYEHKDAVKVMDAWWPRLMPAMFKPALGAALYDRLAGFYKIEDTPNDNGARTNSHASRGWYSYASKDLRTLLGRKVRGKYSRTYCGGTARGSRRKRLARCRAVLVRTLREAIAADPVVLYKDKECPKPADQVCFDSVLHRPLGLIEQPLIHWINRPTFQQIVEVQRRAPR